MLSVKKLTTKTVENLYKVGFISALLIVVGLTLWWTSYRDGGTTYYIKVNRPLSKFSVTVPVNCNKNAIAIGQRRKMPLAERRSLRLKPTNMILAPSPKDNCCDSRITFTMVWHIMRESRSNRCRAKRGIKLGCFRSLILIRIIKLK